jgi:predicted NUDIX family NTP pyrophosphohydrolase
VTYAPAVSIRRSAGILLYRIEGGRLEVLLAHPGGPFFGRKDAGNWSIPKGEPSPEETDMELTARREFEEETGHPVPAGALIELGNVVQKGGKTVFAWAIRGELDPATAKSNTYSFEWPPFSGRTKTFPEIDRVEWFDPTQARIKVKAAQVPFIDRLEVALAPELSGQSELHPPSTESIAETD